MPITRANSVYLAPDHRYESGFVSKNRDDLPITEHFPLEIEAFSLDHNEDTDKILVFTPEDAPGPYLFYGLPAAAEYLDRNYEELFSSYANFRDSIEDMRKGILPEDNTVLQVHALDRDPCWSWM